MGSQDDAALVRRGYEAFSAGDVDTLREIFTEDAVWHTPGSGPLSGDKQGRDAILAYFGELGSRSNGSIKVTVQDITVGDNSIVGVHSSTAERDGKSLNQRQTIVFTVADGKVTEGFEFQEDTAKVADFWS